MKHVKEKIHTTKHCKEASQGFGLSIYTAFFSKGSLGCYICSVAQRRCNNVRTGTKEVLEIEWSNITFHFRTFPKGLCTDMLSIGNASTESSVLLYCSPYELLLPVKSTR